MVRKFRVKINGKVFEVEVEDLTVEEKTSTRSLETKPVKEVLEENKIAEKTRIELEKPPSSTTVPQQAVEKSMQPKEETKEENLKIVTAPMSGVIISVDVEPGSKISVGQTLLVLEAMKMENSLISEYEGVVKEVLVRKGDSVETGQKLLTIV